MKYFCCVMLLFLSVYLVVLLCLMLFLIHFSSFAFFIFTGSYVFFVRVIFRTFGCWCGWFLRHFYYHFERFELLWFIFLLNSVFVKYYPVNIFEYCSSFDEPPNYILKENVMSRHLCWVHAKSSIVKWRIKHPNKRCLFNFLLNSVLVKYYPITAVSSASLFVFVFIFHSYQFPYLFKVFLSLLQTRKLAWAKANYVIFRYSKY